MKNALKKGEAMRHIAIIAIIVISVLAVTACEILSGLGATRTTASATSTAPASKPGLTITGLDDYIGMRIHARGTEDNRTIRAGDRILARGDNGFNPLNEGVMTSAVITSGTITLNVWKIEMGEYNEGPGRVREFTSAPYRGSGKVEMIITVWEQDGSGNAIYSETENWKIDRANDYKTVTFTNGSAHIVFEGSLGM